MAAATDTHLATQQLLNDLLNNPNYSVIVHPNAGTGLRKQIFVYFTLVRLIQLTNDGRITVAGGLVMIWNDQRLMWNPSDYNNVGSLNVPAQQIWSPGLTLLNSVSDNIAVVADNSSAAAIVYHGGITLIVPRLYSAACALNLKYFPFDSQNCSFNFQNIAIGIPEHESIIFIMPSPTVNTEMMTHSGEFTFIGSNMANGTIPLSTFNVNFPSFTITLNYVRNPSYYVANVAVPSTLLLFASAFIFFLPSDSNVKITMACSLMVSLYILQQAVVRLLPASQGMPILAAGMIAELALGCYSVLCAVLTVTLRSMQPRLNNCCIKLVATVERLFCLSPTTTLSKTARKNKVGPDVQMTITKSTSNVLSITSGGVQSVPMVSYHNETMEQLMKAILYSVNLQTGQIEAAVEKSKEQAILNRQWRILDFLLNMLLFVIYVGVLVFTCYIFLFDIADSANVF